MVAIEVEHLERMDAPRRYGAYHRSAGPRWRRGVNHHHVHTVVSKPSHKLALPSPNQAKEGASVAATNAHDLLEAARRLGRVGFHGPASALLVLALEESEKARALLVIVTGHDRQRLSVDELRNIIFRDHGLRHRTALAESMSPMFILRHLNPRKPPNALQKRQDESESAAIRWHLGANDLKKRGFYVDLVDGRWHSPRDIDEDTFTEGLEIVGRFIRLTSRQVHTASNQ
jgi:AbiV family abortive infection protein